MFGFLYDEKGAEMVEYILLTALIAIAAIKMVNYFQEEISQAFYKLATELGRMTQ